MLNKRQHVGTAQRTTTAKVYRDVFDWETFWGLIFWAFIGLGVIGLIF